MDITAVCKCFLLLFVCFTCQGCMEEERNALLQIKTSINIPEGTAFSNWYGKECCKWDGVECNANTTRVSMIYIMHKRDSSLSESWYPNASLFAQFKDLKELLLPGNHIGGFTSIHELNKLKHLQTLDLRDNDIADGSHLCWGKLHSLNSLYLSNNNLRGNFPNCLCENPSIYELYLSDNELEGNIPACLGNMTSLKYLDLTNNELNGSFPSLLIRNLTSIEHLSLSRNVFRGRVSLSIFANLSRLGYLDISYNSPLEVEPDSPTWFPSFSLYVLKLAGYNLKSIPRFLSRQHHLVSLDLSDNLLVGRIPSWLMYNFSTSELRIRGNKLNGMFPTIQNISSRLTVLDISKNNLQGPLPKEIGQIFPQLLLLDVSSNSFNGNLPQSFGKMNKLERLILSDNEFHGEIPHSLTMNTTSLQYLRLSKNKLSGAAFPTNASLPNLRWLSLGWNDFSGTFPGSLSKSVEMQVVGMQSSGLSGQLSPYLPALPRLKALLLGGNRLEGSIPSELCQMMHLHLLDLSRNNLSGDIPTCLNNISSWTEGSYHMEPLAVNGKRYLYFKGIDISCNKLTREIPIQLTHLVHMLFLNMSYNLLTGQIHKSLSNLTTLEALDLSHNKFFGGLSPELTALGFLQALNFSFNNLSGKIPSGSQFDTFSEDSYLGNPLLCGSPLAKECHERAETSGCFSSNIATVRLRQHWFSSVLSHEVCIFLFCLIYTISSICCFQPF